jgi:hypothetical protein
MTTCAYDLSPDTTYCNTGNVVKVTRSSGGVAKIDKVTYILTTIDKYGPLFAGQYDSYWSTYDNYGLKHAQLRFYQTATCYKNTWVA